MKIEPYDHPLRFMVESQRADKHGRLTQDTHGADAYLVDLGENKGHGKCGCPHFDFRIQPELDLGHAAPRCKHLIAAREHLLQLVITKLTTP